MFRKTLFAATIGLIAASTSQAQECTPETSSNSCVDGGLQYCSEESGTLEVADCTYPDENGVASFPNNTCGSFPCTDLQGNGCEAYGVGDSCVATAGNACIGVAVLFTEDPEDDQYAAAVPCGAGEGACIVGAEGESCVPSIPDCTDFGVSCSDNLLVMCLFGVSEDANDDGTLGSDEEDVDGDGEVDALIFSMPTGIDCAALGGTCSNSATAGPLHDLLAAQGAQGQPLPDCVFPDTPAPGEGEGEGEGPGGGGDAQCTEDSECGRDRQCVDGECVAAEDEDEDEDDDGGTRNVNLSCASSSSDAPFAALLVGLAALARRRRR